MKYTIAKQNAIRFADEKKKPVYIAKSNSSNHCVILFTKANIPHNHHILETIAPKEVQQ